MIDLETLAKFCGSPDGLYPALSEPFSLREFTYATDGAAMVRVPGNLTKRRKPRCIRIDIGAFFRSWFRFDPRYSAAVAEFEIPDPVEMPCVECLALNAPYPECDECGGTGSVKQYWAARLSEKGNAFNTGYLHLIAALPEASISDIPVGGGPSPHRSFVFEGGQGLLMPFRTDCEQFANSPLLKRRGEPSAIEREREAVKNAIRPGAGVELKSI